MLKPYLAKDKAKAFPIPIIKYLIPSDEPVMNTQLFSPYLFLRFLRLRRSFNIFEKMENSFLIIIRAPINWKTVVVFGNN